MNTETAWTPATFTDDEFEALLESSKLDRMGRFELRRGALARMNAQFTPHLQAKMQLLWAVRDAIKDAGLVLEIGSEGTVKFGDGFSPLPDIVVYEPHAGKKAIPGSVVRWIIEVADSTLADDLGDKREDYARAGLAEYWVADVNAKVIHAFADPDREAGVYRRATLTPFGADAPSLTLAGVIVATGQPG